MNAKHSASALAGRNAFDFEPEAIRFCVTVPPRVVLTVARRQLDQLVAMLEEIPGPVDTLMIIDEWTGKQAAQWFREFRQALNAATIGTPSLSEPS